MIELRNRQHGDILTVAGHPFRADVLFKCTAFGIHLVPNYAPHRLFGFDPRPARLTPTRSIEHHQLHTYTVRFFERVVSRLDPFRLQHLNRIFSCLV